jgi:hypothetical protein
VLNAKLLELTGEERPVALSMLFSVLACEGLVAVIQARNLESESRVEVQFLRGQAGGARCWEVTGNRGQSHAAFVLFLVWRHAKISTVSL